MSETISIPTKTINSRNKILLEVVAMIIVAILSKEFLSLFFWKFAAPVSLAATLVLVTVVCRRNGISWSDMGLKKLKSWKARLLVAPQALLVGVAFAAVVAATFGTAHLLGFDLLSEPPSGVEDRWGNVKGNLAIYLLWLFIVWTCAAFGEEMFFRGYLITRLQTAFKDVRFGSALAVIIPAALFGCAHFYYQGVRGLIVTGVIGMTFGTMFLLYKRNLWPLVLWHGLVDTLTFTAMFMDWDV